RLLFALALVAAAAGAPAGVVRADNGSAEVSQVARLLDRAAPEVRQALAGDGGLAARGALSAIAARGAISTSQLEGALGKPDFAPYARETLTALAKVDRVAGVPDTFGRLVSAGNEGALVGPAFEIQVAAAFGADKVQGVGVMVDGNEVDLLLRDGTRVEAKSFPDNNPKLTAKMAAKATDQLALRGAHGDEVMLVTNRPLDADSLARFRQRVGRASSVMVLQRGALTQQLGRAAESRAQKARRIATGRLRKAVHRGQARVRPVQRWMKKNRPSKVIRRVRSGGRPFVRARAR